MRFSVTGFPRIGAHRELKFATEKYWKGEADAEQLMETVRTQRQLQWELQQKAGASFIPSNDYSLYDGMLDTACLLGAIPARFAALGVGDLDTYFAMGKGYQDAGKDATALAMKKWFNTNYHYMVPELEDDMTLSLRSHAFLDGYFQAKSLGIDTKPVIIGPFTFWKLARATGQKDKAAFLPMLAECYSEILRVCAAEGVAWLQVDEPSLVMDVDRADIDIFTKLYEEILPNKGDVKVLLETYFGDIRDCYDEVCALAFDGLGLDFVEGKQTAALVGKHFPQGKILFAGLINGKNIWRCDYAKVLAQLTDLEGTGAEVVLQTSCSLLHVPYTTENETDLPESVKRHFAFACEKLDEMREICVLLDTERPKETECFCKNRALFAKNDLRTDEDVRQAVAALKDDDFVRNLPRKKRQALQRRRFNLPLFPTTTIGSFPQTKEVKQNRARFRHGEISEREYNDEIRRMVKNCIAEQEELGLDVLVHGEYERNDMVEFFGENLSGYVFTKNAWVQSYGTRGVKPPIIFGDIRREKPITVALSAYANSLTEKEVKGMLTGPVTILNWSFPREDIPIREEMYQIALAIREEVLDLEAAGIHIIQIDEAALREKLPLRRADWHSDYLDDAIRAFRLCHSGVRPETQIHTHMCYSEFADIIPEIDAMDADVITFEASRSQLTILDALREHDFETEIGPGVYDIHSPRVPSVEEMEQALYTMAEKLPVENIWVNPDCGLKTRGEEETLASLRNMVQAAKNMRAK